LKFSVSVTPAKPKFAPLVFTGGIYEYLPLIADLGYDAIELHIGNPATLDRQGLRKKLDEHGLSISMIGTGLAFGEEGLSWIDSDPDIRQKAIQRFKDHVDFASEYGAVVAVGLIRGKNLSKDTAVAEVQKQMVLDSCRECARHAEGTDVILGIEPINRYEVDFIMSVDDATEFVKRVDSPAAGILVDTFHMNIEDVSMPDAIQRAGKLITHVHLSDSNRWAPGFGHLDILDVLGALKGVGYNRYISSEVLPMPSPTEAAAQAITYVKALLGHD
jgi:5-keto-L-gluconate epimerase